jgi:hypothetical protein
MVNMLTATSLLVFYFSTVKKSRMLGFSAILSEGDRLVIRANDEIKLEKTSLLSNAFLRSKNILSHDLTALGVLHRRQCI